MAPAPPTLNDIVAIPNRFVSPKRSKQKKSSLFSDIP